MKPEKQRIAIAEICGWRTINNCGSIGGVILYSPTGSRCEGVWSSHDHALSVDTPDYLNDLNACHAFEEQLTWSHQDGRGTCSIYRDHLERIVHAKWKSRDTECAAECHEWHATASQRCEAFLRTLGKWEDEK